MKRTAQELQQWAENIAVQGYGRVSQKLVRGVVEDRANTEELGQGFTRREIRAITQLVNEIQNEIQLVN